MDELKKQQEIDDKEYDQKLKDDAIRKLECDELQKNIIMNGDMMKDMRRVEFLGPKVDYTCWKEKF